MIEKIEWDSKYSVAVDEIDSHQKKMFELFNQLIEMRQTKADPKAFMNLVSDLNDYSKQFFSSEEKLLRRRNYPDYESHTKAHRQFTRNAIGLRREIAEDINNLTLEHLVELRDWLIDHIETSDSLYVPFVRINQYIDDTKQK